MSGADEEAQHRIENYLLLMLPAPFFDRRGESEVKLLMTGAPAQTFLTQGIYVVFCGLISCEVCQGVRSKTVAAAIEVDTITISNGQQNVAKVQ